MPMVFCRSCGHRIHESAAVCPQCGAPQAIAIATLDLRSQNLAALWCAFLGAFGAHKFYLGKIFPGILYLLFSWTSITVVLAYIDLLVIAFTSQEKWAYRYNAGRLTAPVHLAVRVIALIAPLVLAVGLFGGVMLPAYHDHEQRGRTVQTL